MRQLDAPLSTHPSQYSLRNSSNTNGAGGTRAQAGLHRHQRNLDETSGAAEGLCAAVKPVLPVHDVPEPAGLVCRTVRKYAMSWKVRAGCRAACPGCAPSCAAWPRCKALSPGCGVGAGSNRGAASCRPSMYASAATLV